MHLTGWDHRQCLTSQRINILLSSFEELPTVPSQLFSGSRILSEQVVESSNYGENYDSLTVTDFIVTAAPLAEV